jgi:predicted site-specific integrase-resolvase
MQAAKIAGVSKRTIHYWIALGKAEWVRSSTGHVLVYLDTLPSKRGAKVVTHAQT